MNSKNIFIIIVTCLFFANTFAQDATFVKTEMEKDTKSSKKAWYIPDYAKIQFAGNIGLLSAGIGYEVANNVLYSELLYGFVPGSISNTENIHLITLKNTFPIFTKEIGAFKISPIAGFTTSLETGNNSFLVLPDKYPKGYYVPSAIHFTIFAGGLIHKEFKNQEVFKGADFYVEVGTVETYLWFAATSKEVTFNDVFSSSIGINLYF
jgi:hypothetical protein